MPSLDLRSFVARAGTLVDSSPPASRRETRTWLVEPFLETLGWDLRAESCVTDRTIDDTPLEYVLLVDSVPALFVAVETADEPLKETRANALQQAMAWTGVDRAIYTNGRQYLLLAGTTDIEYHTLRLSELTDGESTVGLYSRDALGRRLAQHSRNHVARQLAIDRSRLVDSIVEQLTAATVHGDVYADEFESATDRFLDQLVVAFTDADPEQPNAVADVSIRFDESTISSETPTDGDTTETESATDPSPHATTDANEDAGTGRVADTTAPTESNDREASTRDDDAEQRGPDDDTDAENGTEDGEEREYVVRLFNDRGSIGAIGHSTSKGALVGATEYLFERGLSGITVPWSPDEADGTVLNSDPIHADGSPMAASTQLSNGLYLETAGTVEERAARVQALAARAGLRAMLTGDWDT
ncbi:hypothetical protein [Natrinema longum]|uniref:Restriction endonuclease n=1 Tax=Natrinema longum TaxID=370324 RepID=A0A8A2U8W2_9EURY|nr:hypothetical protein [Natrinema longum]MBZ6493862.1 hypothetical protein [Natrinema longum]QSW84802.1 hypothetical protein J0X27_15325 [Natrinema longum]